MGVDECGRDIEHAMEGSAHLLLHVVSALVIIAAAAYGPAAALFKAVEFLRHVAHVVYRGDGEIFRFVADVIVDHELFAQDIFVYAGHVRIGFKRGYLVFTVVDGLQTAVCHDQLVSIFGDSHLVCGNGRASAEDVMFPEVAAHELIARVRISGGQGGVILVAAAMEIAESQRIVRAAQKARVIHAVTVIAVFCKVVGGERRGHRGFVIVRVLRLFARHKVYVRAFLHRVELLLDHKGVIIFAFQRGRHGIIHVIHHHGGEHAEQAEGYHGDENGKEQAHGLGFKSARAHAQRVPEGQA